MERLETKLDGLVLLAPAKHGDERGFFIETFRAETWAAHGVPTEFLQDNHSSSVKDTLRGLHMQWRKPQGKLVRVVRGEIWDVAVDIRPESPTYKRWVGMVLSAENYRQIWVPPGFAHGFCVLSDIAQVEYKVTTFWDRSDEISIAWNDPDLAVAWPVDDPLLSDKDRAAPRLAQLEPLLVV